MYVCTYICLYVSLYVCMHVCILENLLWCISQMSGHATRTLDIAIAVAFMLTLKMDEEALDRCIEKTLWCMPHYCKRKQRANHVVTTYVHKTCDSTHTRRHIPCIYTDIYPVVIM